MHGHLVHGQTPPLVDSVHFLARADPREPGEGSRGCSAAKVGAARRHRWVEAMGYLASALVLSQEEDAQIREEALDSCSFLSSCCKAKELVTSAWTHKKCRGSEPRRKVT